MEFAENLLCALQDAGSNREKILRDVVKQLEEQKIREKQEAERKQVLVKNSAELEKVLNLMQPEARKHMLKGIAADQRAAYETPPSQRAPSEESTKDKHSRKSGTQK